jgi:predicted dehydrogenase
MNTKRWRIGLVGVGRGSGYGKLFAEHPACEVVACCDASEEALARFQKELKLPDTACHADYERFLSVPMDAVFIGTPIPCHADQTVRAMEAGLHVLCEVTAAYTVEECRRIVAAVRKAGRIYMLAENCIYWPFIQEWKKTIGAGRIGEVFYAECEYLHPIRHLLVDPSTGAPRWRANRPPLHYCSHSLGPVLELTGDRIVRAMGVGQGHRILPAAGVGGIDIQIGLFETRRGTLIKLLRSSVIPRHPAMHYYMLQGTKGFIETDRLGPRGPGHLYVEGEMDKPQEIALPLVDASLPESARAGGHGTAEYSLIRDFLSALETGRKPFLDEVRAMDLTVPGLIAHESAMKGGVWLDVPDLK